jgi:hypothetical protein
MLNNSLHFIKKSVVNYQGFKTNRKLIVIESDDWGSIRMPSTQVFSKLKDRGIPVDKSPYCRFDSLESNTDLEYLFEILTKFKDINGNHPIITANTVVGNPDFEKIKQSQFNKYFFESFYETLARYPNRDKVVSYYKQGIKSKIFIPQFHGREHVNVEMWLDLLKSNKQFQFAFEHGLWGLSTDVFPNFNKSIQATLDSFNDNFLISSINSGLILFEELFGYKSKSFIANNFIWNSTLNSALKANGIEFLQGMKYQILPKNGYEKRKLVRHYLGKKNNLGQFYLIRNCSFEPSLDNSGTNKTIQEIQNAFFWKKPAIISTHRINFIGDIVESNRTKNLKDFELLLKNILKMWPNVEFVSSNVLGEIIKLNKNDKIK